MGTRIKASIGDCTSVDSKSRSPNRPSHRLDSSRKEYYSNVSTTESSLVSSVHAMKKLAQFSCCEIESLTVHILLSITLQSITLTYYLLRNGYDSYSLRYRHLMPDNPETSFLSKVTLSLYETDS